MSTREQLQEIFTISRKMFSSLDYDEILRLVEEEAPELGSSDEEQAVPLSNARRALGFLADQAALAMEQALRYRALMGGADRQSWLLRAIFENTPHQLALVDHQLRFLEANASYCAKSGWPRDKLLGRRFAQVNVGRERQEVLERAVATGAPAEQRELPRAEPAGSSYWSFSALPILDTAGQVEGVLLSEMEVTELVAARLEREQNARDLAEVNEGKDYFLNALSHELRTPMSVSLNAVELLQDERASAQQRERSLEILERSVRNQARLVDDLLDLSRVMRGKLQLASQPVELVGVVRQQLEALAGEIEQAELAVHPYLPEQPVWVLGDRVRLGQIALHLLTNAIKYTPPGGEVAVRLEQQADRAILSVRDTGIGISQELLPRLFQPFRQLESSIARRAGGLGIGLTISKSLVEQHQGTISVASEGVGGGAEFVVSLPLLQAEAATAVESDPLRRAHELQRVLVVEDNNDLRATLTDLLELMGHTVICVGDGQSAIEVAEQAAPSVALIDIGLPDISGFEVARELRRRQGQGQGLKLMHLVAITGFASPENRERALQSGFNGFLTKPVDLETLRHVLQPGA